MTAKRLGNEAVRINHEPQRDNNPSGVRNEHQKPVIGLVITYIVFMNCKQKG